MFKRKLWKNLTEKDFEKLDEYIEKRFEEIYQEREQEREGKKSFDTLRKKIVLDLTQCDCNLEQKYGLSAKYLQYIL